MNKAVFLDRDGTINIEKNYLYKIEDFEFITGATEAIKLLNENNYKVIVVTNQAGVGRGYYKEPDVHKLHNYIQEELKKYNTKIDGFYYCPHHPVHGISEYKLQCECRKPKDGLYKLAIEEYNLDPKLSYGIGDKLSDLEPIVNLGGKGILVRTGYGKTYEEHADSCNIHIEDNILEAVKHIIKGALNG